MINNNLKGILAIVVASLLWGTTGTAASFSDSINALGIGAFSTGVGGFLLALTSFNKLIKDYRILLKQWRLFLLGAFAVAAYPLAFYSSMKWSGVAIGTIVSIASAPIFAVLVERLFSQKLVSRKWFICFTLGTVGVVLLTTGKEYVVVDGDYGFEQQSIGIALGCIAGGAYACYSWIARGLIEMGAHHRSALSGLFGGAALLLLPLLWFTGENLFLNVTNSLVAIYMAIVPMFLGYLLFSYGLKFVETSNATLITLIEPLIATLLAVSLLGESFDTVGWLGAFMLFLCLLIQSFEVKTSSVVTNLVKKLK